MRLIDADAVIGEIKKDRIIAGSLYQGIDIALDVFHDAVVDSVNDTPTIDPLSHGHWCNIEGMDILHEYYHCSCSECGEIVCGKAEVVKRFKLYCSHCGARMDGERLND